MLDVEDICVKYLMNEMDPAERFSFEEKLKADPNLIIEVEMMRKTLARIKELPVIKVPEQLSERVQFLAAKTSRKRRFVHFATSGNMRYAAVIGAIGFAFSVGWVLNQSPNLRQSLQSNSYNGIKAEKAKGQWVDKKDVIHIDAYNVASNNESDSLALKNAKKLRLIDKPLIDKPYSEELLLTRTRK